MWRDSSSLYAEPPETSVEFAARLAFPSRRELSGATGAEEGASARNGLVRDFFLAAFQAVVQSVRLGCLARFFVHGQGWWPLGFRYRESDHCVLLVLLLVVVSVRKPMANSRG